MRRLALPLAVVCAVVCSVAAEAEDAEDAEHVWTIRVLDPEGKPVPRARLWLQEKGASNLDQQFRYVENGRTEHRSRHPGSRVRVEVMQAEDADGRPLPLGATFSGPHEPGEIVVRLAPEKEIRGVVRTPEGKPVEGATVHAIRDADDAEIDHAEALSDTSGAFRLRRLGAFPYRLVTEPPAGFVSLEPVHVTAGTTDATVVLRALVEPRLVVRGPDGTTLPGCRVRVERPDADDLVRTTDERGAVVFPHLDPTRPHPLRIDGPDDRALPRFDPGWLPRSGTVVLERAFSIEGIVRREDGAAVPDASVWVRSVPGAKAPLPADWSWLRLEDGSLQGALTDERGRFVIRGLPRSDLLVFAATVLDGGEVVRGEPVRVSPGAKEVVLRLPAR